MDPHRLLALFLSEGRELLNRLDAELLVLERAPDTRAAIDAVFRALHSMKGMTATVGLPESTAALHAGESLLSLARDAGVLSVPQLTALLELNDVMRRALDAAEQGRAEPLALAGLTLALDALTPQAMSPRDARDRAGAVRAIRRAVATDQAPALSPTHGDDAVDDGPAHPAARDTVAARTVRIPAQRLDDLLDLVGELVLARDRLVRTAQPSADDAARQALDDTTKLVTQLRDAILTSRMVPLSQVFDRFPRHVRDTAHALGKDIELVLEGRELEVDRSLLDELSEPLLHLLRNAIDHGLETPDERRSGGKESRGRLVVRATRDGSMVAVTVADDGRGVNRQRVAASATAQGVVGADALVQDDAGLLQLLARPGLSTAETVTDLSGRGVGVDAVLSRVQALGGRLDLATAEGAGTAITIRLPLSVAMLRALIVRVADETYAIPLAMVHATHLRDVSPRGDDASRQVVDIAGERLKLVSLRSHLGIPASDDVSGHLVVLDGATGRVALLVDACTSHEEIVVKPLQKVRGAAAMFSGGTILPDGTPSLILDINTLP